LLLKKPYLLFISRRAYCLTHFVATATFVYDLYTDFSGFVFLPAYIHLLKIKDESGTPKTNIKSLFL
ncbi:MAG: hypothetical protein ACK5R0_22020, partial [Bacteroidota bacterium]